VRRLRSAGVTLPTLILTARCTLTDKVKALDLGADDFLSKPFEPAELVARCRALMRRASGALDGVIKLNRMSVDLGGRRLSIDEEDVELTAREWLLLECLVRRTGPGCAEGARSAGGGEPGARCVPECVGSACVAAARQAEGRRRDPQPARSGLPARRSEVNSSISRQLVLWLAIPLMLLSLCGGLVHYFNNVAPGVIDSDRRLRDAAAALMAHVQVKNARPCWMMPRARRTCRRGMRRSTRFATRVADCWPAMRNSRRPHERETSQLLAMTQWNQHPVRSLTTRFDTAVAWFLITVADLRPVPERAARYGLMSTLLWDFVQLTSPWCWSGWASDRPAAGEKAAPGNRGPLAAGPATDR